MGVISCQFGKLCFMLKFTTYDELKKDIADQGQSDINLRAVSPIFKISSKVDIHVNAVTDSPLQFQCLAITWHFLQEHCMQTRIPGPRPLSEPQGRNHMMGHALGLCVSNSTFWRKNAGYHNIEKNLGFHLAQ